MSKLIVGREFQLWEYHVSHGSLLIRSPAGSGWETSVDIVCVGVEFIAAPRHLGKIAILGASETEIRRLEIILGKELLPSRVWVLESSRERSLVVAAALEVREHRGDIFDSPFK